MLSTWPRPDGKKKTVPLPWYSNRALGKKKERGFQGKIGVHYCICFRTTKEKESSFYVLPSPRHFCHSLIALYFSCNSSTITKAAILAEKRPYLFARESCRHFPFSCHFYSQRSFPSMSGLHPVCLVKTIYLCHYEWL